MNDPRGDLIDESVLRRAMRLEPDERAPHFDARAIALMAERGALPWWTVFSAFAGVVVLGVAATLVWSVVFAFFPALIDAAMSALIAVAIWLATVLEPAAGIAAQPAIPLSLLAALSVAILGELRERREPTHVNAS